MGYRLREIEPGCKFSDEIGIDAIARSVPIGSIRTALEVEGVREVRARKLCMESVILLLIAMNLYTQLSMGHVRW